ncbi:MAG: gluconokinase, partial [Paracoccus sp. (in: a-proteobacteria)]|nr:gluconokinase [Paracoccus sp. (in: a-proteobacteria)]
MTTRPILVMGICGVGKSTIAQGIADRVGGQFIEADEFHDDQSVAHMRDGQPLTDDMRWGWLDRLGDAVNAAPKRAVLACSALGRAHRDRLRARTGPIDIVF